MLLAHCILCLCTHTSGDIEQLKWLAARGEPVNTQTARYAAFGGSVPVFQWLQQQPGVEFDSDTMRNAAFCGHLQLCQ
jgi:hypothetical protein